MVRLELGLTQQQQQRPADSDIFWGPIEGSIHSWASPEMQLQGTEADRGLLVCGATLPSCGGAGGILNSRALGLVVCATDA